MNRLSTAVMALVLIVATIGSAPLAGASATNDVDEPEITPGEQLSGVVGVQEAELDGEMEERTFAVRVANATSNDARADAVAEQLHDTEARLDELERRKAAVEERRADGEATDGQYAAEMARIAAEIETVERLIEASEREAGDLPEELSNREGVNEEAIATLQDRASELEGPEVTTTARSIAGGIDENDREERDDDDRDDRDDQEERDDDERDDEAEETDRDEREEREEPEHGEQDDGDEENERNDERTGDNDAADAGSD